MTTYDVTRKTLIAKDCGYRLAKTGGGMFELWAELEDYEKPDPVTGNVVLVDHFRTEKEARAEFNRRCRLQEGVDLSRWYLNAV